MQYWNEGPQRTARKKLEFGKYSQNGKISRCQYALDLSSIASELTDSRDESEIISRISIHFERDVRGEIRELGTKNKQNILLALSDFDNNDAQTRMRENAEKQQEKTCNG